MGHAPRLLAAVLLLAAGLLPALGAQAASREPARPDWHYRNLVALDFVKPLVTVPNPEGVMLIDSRPYMAKYVGGFIPTAVSIPDSEFDTKTGLLPRDKKALLVFYCEGPE